MGASSAEGGAGRPIEENKDARTMAMLAHLLAIPLAFLGPLLIWLIKKDQHPFVDDQGKEALNFNIMLAIAYVACGLLTIVCIGALLLPLVWIVNIVFAILGGMAANRGEWYRYPFSLRLIK